jgi:flagellar hook protein FlgE
MMRALYTAVSGLANHMRRFDVIGNNIANVNTTGFKAGRANFEDAFIQMQRAASGPVGTRAGLDPIQVGGGSVLGSVSQFYTQGSLMTTGLATDLAIQGSGLFVLSDGQGTYYTRDGAFQIDAAGRMVSPTSGLTVQGYLYDRASKTYGTALTDIQIPINSVDPARATTSIQLSGNLNADSAPLGSVLETGALYAASGSPAAGTTALIDLRSSTTDTTPLALAGDTLRLSAKVGGESVSAQLTVAAGTTVNDLLTALAQMLNSPTTVDGATATLDAEGHVRIASPDALGLGGAASELSLAATDAQGADRGVFATALAFDGVQTARDAVSYKQTTRVYDSLGFAHDVTLSFTRVSGANEFTWKASVAGTGATVLDGGSGRVRFGSDGTLVSVDYGGSNASAASALRLSLGTGAQGPLTIKLDGGAADALSGLTMMSGTTSVESSQDGYAQGAFTDFSTDELGQVLASFSNGVQRAVARLAIAEFINPAGLTHVGHNAYVENANTGTPVLGAAGDGTIGSTMVAGALEQSNVDLAQEFTDMVVAQRGFQANARVITASDEMLTDLVNIRR